jgi:SAM-dependent methyltransferase
MDAFVERLAVRPHQRVLDLGGNIEIWASIKMQLPLSVTLLNTTLDRGDSPRHWRHPRNGVTCQCVVGDACDLSAYDDGAFDIVFSNSVIEHLGDDQRVAAFCAGVRRVGRSYWVQTPCWLFPLEAHTRLPGFWLWPAPLRRLQARRIDDARRQEPWFCPMETTRHFRLAKLRTWLPDAEVYTERLAGLPKSWSLYRRRAAS